MLHSYQKFYEDLKLTGKSDRTIQTYEKHLQKIDRFYNKSPDQINEEELRGSATNLWVERFFLFPKRGRGRFDELKINSCFYYKSPLPPFGKGGGLGPAGL